MTSRWPVATLLWLLLPATVVAAVAGVVVGRASAPDADGCAAVRVAFNDLAQDRSTAFQDALRPQTRPPGVRPDVEQRFQSLLVRMERLAQLAPACLSRSQEQLLEQERRRQLPPRPGSGPPSPPTRPAPPAPPSPPPTPPD